MFHFFLDGSFCACTNSNTNTYWCVRTINITHNYLYCEFVSGIITYYDLNIDPYQLRNIYQTLSDAELNYMHGQVMELKTYGGSSSSSSPSESSPFDLEIEKGGGKRRKAAKRQQKFLERYGTYVLGMTHSIVFCVSEILFLNSFPENVFPSFCGKQILLERF